jgi:hypothetical protein
MWFSVYRDITCVHMCLIMFNIQYFFVWHWLSNIKCNWCYPLCSEAPENYNVWSRLYTHELWETYASAIVDEGSSIPADEHRFVFSLWWVHLTTCMIWIVIDAIVCCGLVNVFRAHLQVLFFTNMMNFYDSFGFCKDGLNASKLRVYLPSALMTVSTCTWYFSEHKYWNTISQASQMSLKPDW